MTESEPKQDTGQAALEIGITTEQTAKEVMSVPLLPPEPQDLDASRTEFSEEDLEDFLAALKRSKQELDIARQQFENVTDQRLIDHVVFRLGAAERHFSYLLQLARQWGLAVNTMRWDWSEEA